MHGATIRIVILYFIFPAFTITRRIFLQEAIKLNVLVFFFFAPAVNSVCIASAVIVIRFSCFIDVLSEQYSGQLV